MSKSAARITAIGSYVPEKRLTNLDLEQLVETNDEWILQRTGIRERRIAGEHEFTSDISVSAAKDLAERYGKSFDDVDLIIACTMTPDFKTPSVAAMVQAKLNIPNAGAIDLNAACAGFSYGLQMANGLITSGLHKKILVIGAETFSKILDYTDRSTCILFATAAGQYWSNTTQTTRALSNRIWEQTAHWRIICIAQTWPAKCSAKTWLPATSFGKTVAKFTNGRSIPCQKVSMR